VKCFGGRPSVTHETLDENRPHTTTNNQQCMNISVTHSANNILSCVEFSSLPLFVCVSVMRSKSYLSVHVGWLRSSSLRLHTATSPHHKQAGHPYACTPLDVRHTIRASESAFSASADASFVLGIGAVTAVDAGLSADFGALEHCALRCLASAIRVAYEHDDVPAVVCG
jgi:hypothetical protein